MGPTTTSDGAAEADAFRDACGVFGVWDHAEASRITYLGLHALQHRGQESAGIATFDGAQLYVHRQMGLVQEVFTPEVIDKLAGRSAIGHVRYSTAGGSHIRNAQPFAVDVAGGSLALAHNGNLTNAEELRRSLEARGSIFQSSADTEVIAHLIALSREKDVVDKIADALRQVQGAYSLVVLTDQALYAVRDPYGVRPLCLGRLGDSPVAASETTAFDLIGAEFVREIAPGELLVLGRHGEQGKPKSYRPFGPAPSKFCVFEYVYFARPDSRLGDQNVYGVRKRLGAELAREHPAEADLVVPVPDSGLPAAIGFANESKIPFEMALIRSHYIGRTFIEPTQAIRNFGVKLKLNPVPVLLEDRRVVVIDDSIVRGTTSKKLVKMLRDAGAKEVHLRISSPPTRWPCFYGIDTPTRRELIASSHGIEEIRQFVGADSLGYLSNEGMLRAVGGPPGGHCDACFSGNYPITFTPPAQIRQMRLIGV